MPPTELEKLVNRQPDNAHVIWEKVWKHWTMEPGLGRGIQRETNKQNTFVNTQLMQQGDSPGTKK